VETVGRAMLHTMAVWLVRVTPNPRTTAVGPVLLAIAQDSHRLVRESVTLGIKGANPGLTSMILDYSRYGGPVSVRLPNACS
jgi:hypothetical protein